ncbi:MAG: hypothetical protein ACI4S4_01695, partial [Candidatus Ornithospirochaeta sp.]
FCISLVVTDKRNVLILQSEDGCSLPSSFGENEENPQKCARRLCSQVCGESPSLIVSLPYAGRMEIESVPEEIRRDWPRGARTIPSYAFVAEVKDLEESGIRIEEVPGICFSTEKDRQIWQIAEGNAF